MQANLGAIVSAESFLFQDADDLRFHHAVCDQGMDALHRRLLLRAFDERRPVGRTICAPLFLAFRIRHPAEGNHRGIADDRSVRQGALHHGAGPFRNARPFKLCESCQHGQEHLADPAGRVEGHPVEICNAHRRIPFRPGVDRDQGIATDTEPPVQRGEDHAVDLSPFHLGHDAPAALALLECDGSRCRGILDIDDLLPFYSAHERIPGDDLPLGIERANLLAGRRANIAIDDALFPSHDDPP